MYDNVDYWDERYTISGHPYEWYMSWPEVFTQAKLSLREGSNVLHIGCGISDLASHLKESYNLSSLNIDCSNVAITKMSTMNEFIDVKYKKLNVLHMSFDNEFDYVFDKALFDNILCSKDPEASVNKLLSNVYDSLRFGGLYIIVSFGLIGMRMSFLRNLDWQIQHTVLTTTNNKGENNRYNLFICQKCNKS